MQHHEVDNFGAADEGCFCILRLNMQGLLLGRRGELYLLDHLYIINLNTMMEAYMETFPRRKCIKIGRCNVCFWTSLSRNKKGSQ